MTSPDQPTAAAPAPPAPATSPPPWSRREAAARLLILGLIGTAFTLVVGQSYLGYVPAGTSFAGWLATLTAFAATAAMLNAVAYAIALPVALSWRRPLALRLVCPLPFVALNLLIYADTVIYGLFRSHFNGMILNVLTTPGAGDTVTVGRGTVISATLVVLGILAVCHGAGWCATLPRMVRLLRWRMLGPTLAVVVAVVLADKVCYAWADLVNRTEFTRVRQLFPFYPSVTVRRIAQRLGMDIVRAQDLPTQFSSSSTLAYPKAVELPAAPKRLNVVIIAIEGCRFDMLDPAVMPRLHAWSRNEIVGRHHYSGGNATRFGIFSILYGLYGTYWQQVLAERQGPYLIHALKQLGYRIQIQSCTDLNFPEFRKTAFVEVPDAITDQWTGARVDRDRDLTSNAVNLIAAGNEPFFSFLFYDASHATYIYPPVHEKFLPVVAPDSVDFLAISRQVSSTQLRPLFNRYRNSLHYVDEQIGRVIDALAAKGVLDRTLVFVVGDHGEEFGEGGRYGHNGSFSRWQIQTAMVAHIPGEAARELPYLTSHLDIVPTILGAIGVRSPFARYCQGLPLTVADGRGAVVSASWAEAALIDADSTMVMGLESFNPSLEIVDRDYLPFPDQGAAVAKRRAALLEMVRRMGEFSR